MNTLEDWVKGTAVIPTGATPENNSMRPRWNDKPDHNLADIIAAFEKQGACVRRGPPLDLWIGYRGRWCPIEVKNPSGRNRLQATQADFVGLCADRNLPAFVVREGEAVSRVLDVLVRNWPLPKKVRSISG